MSRAAVFLTSVLMSVPAWAEIIVHQFTGTVAGGVTIQGTFWYDTSRVTPVDPIFGGNQWTFSAGGLGASVLSVAIESTQSFHYVICQQVNGRDQIALAVSGQSGANAVIFKFGI